MTDAEVVQVYADNQLQCDILWEELEEQRDKDEPGVTMREVVVAFCRRYHLPID